MSGEHQYAGSEDDKKWAYSKTGNRARVWQVLWYRIFQKSSRSGKDVWCNSELAGIGQHMSCECNIDSSYSLHPNPAPATSQQPSIQPMQSTDEVDWVEVLVEMQFIPAATSLVVPKPTSAMMKLLWTGTPLDLPSLTLRWERLSMNWAQLVFPMHHEWWSNWSFSSHCQCWLPLPCL